MQKYSILNKQIYWDTGIIKNVFHNKYPNNFKTFWNSLKERNFYNSNSKEYIHLFTPLMLFECLGYKLKDIDPYYSDFKLKEDIDNILKTCTCEEVKIVESFEKIVKVYQAFFIDHHTINLISMKYRLENEIKFRCDDFKKTFRDLAENRLNSESCLQNLIADLISDRVQALPLDDVIKNKEIVKEIEIYWLHNIKYSISKINYSMARVSNKLVKKAQEHINKKSTSSLLNFRTIEESLDTEIVHLSLFGAYYQKKRLPLAIFTRESKQSWIEKIRGYISMLKFQSEYSDISVCPGLIFHVNQNGEITEDPIDVRSEFNFTGFDVVQDRIWKN